MRVLLLNAPFHPRFSRSQRSPARTKSGNLYYPIWLGYACGALEQAGHHVLLLDAPARGLSLPTVVTIARQLNPGLIVIDTCTPSVINDLSVSRQLREALPEAFQVFVGTHATALPKETLAEAPWVDAIARREYDQTLVDLAGALEAGSGADGLLGTTYRTKDDLVEMPDRPELTAEQLDRLPYISEVWKKHVRIEDYFYSITPHPQITLVTGRGCPYKCDFCVWPQLLTGHGYRRRSVENVVDEFVWIDRHLPGVHVFIEDDTLTVNKKRCRELAEGLIRARCRVRFTANSRADVDYETLALLKRAGLRMVCTGFESADDNILEQVQKRLEVDQAYEFAEAAKRAKVMVHACFMVGNPGETPQTLRKTLEFAKRLRPDSAQFFPLMVYPGTRAFDRAAQDGALTSRNWAEWLTDEGLHNTVINRPGLPAASLVSWCDHARREFYQRPGYLVRKAWQSLLDPRELSRNVRAARELSSHLWRSPA